MPFCFMVSVQKFGAFCCLLLSLISWHILHSLLLCLNSGCSISQEKGFCQPLHLEDYHGLITEQLLVMWANLSPLRLCTGILPLQFSCPVEAAHLFSTSPPLENGYTWFQKWHRTPNLWVNRETMQIIRAKGIIRDKRRAVLHCVEGQSLLQVT